MAIPLRGDVATTTDDPAAAPRPAGPGTVRLPDGRHLGWIAYGPADGRAVVHLHGAVGTSLAPDPAMLAALARRRVRLIVPSRPGFGGSDPAPGRRIVDWPADLLALLDRLGVERFGLLAISAGGPYALACARALPASRLWGTLAIGCVAPVVGADAASASSPALRIGAAVARRPTAAGRIGDRVVARARRHPRLIGAAIGLPSSRADRRRLDRGERGQIVDAVLAATARGIGPLVDDVALVLRPWGFLPEEVAGKVLLVHGAQDATVPPAHARDLTRRLPRATLRLRAGEGHYFFRAHLGGLLDELLEMA